MNYIYLFLIHLIVSSTTQALTFNFFNISNHQTKIKLANGDSSFTSGGLQITPNDIANIDRHIAKAGQATYIKPLHLWDSGSGELADFTTTFSFAINSSGNPEYADGLTFFLAENNTFITGGGFLGLPVDPTTVLPTARFVAVEFDTYGNNQWDPENMSLGEHVGIDVSSVTSVVYEKWLTRITLGVEYGATICYNSASKDLSVVFTGYDQNTTRIRQDALHYTVDLRKELPEWVIFGFTAATGGSVESHTIKSWSFKSSNLHAR